MISLAYYLRVIAAVWMRPAPGAEAMPAMAGGSPEARSPRAHRPTPRRGRVRCLMILVPTGICAAATVFFGIIPSPLVDWAANAGESLSTLVG